MKALWGKTIILGLEDGNMERLKQGQPIKFNLQELGLPDFDVVIFNGKDNQTMQQMFKDRIDPLKTIIKDHNAKHN